MSEPATNGAPAEVTLEQQRHEAELDEKLRRFAAEKRVREAGKPTIVQQAVARLWSDAPCELEIEPGKPCGQPGTRYREMPARCPRCASAEIALADARQAIAASATGRTLPPLDVPAKYALATLDSFELHGDERTVRRLERLLDVGRTFIARFGERASSTFPQMLVLQGGHGTGKGHWMWGVVKSVREHHGASVLVTSVGDFVREVRSTWGRRDGPTETAVLNRYRRADLVIFNELSRHALLNEPMQHLFDVIDPRQEEHRPTIVVSNETDDGELASLLGPALTSRLREWSGILDFGDVDYRATVLAARRRASRTEGA